MPTTYEYSLSETSENGSLFCKRAQPTHEQTRGLFIDDRDDGYRGLGCDWGLGHAR